MLTRAVALLSLLLASALAFAQEPDIARMDALIAARVADKSFMGAVLVARGDEVLLSKGYGFANLEWSIPNTPTTKFRLGSITKQFTAAAILKLAEQGQLALEDPVKKHYPNAPASWDAITVFQLLTHTSGIPNVTSAPDFAQWKMHPSTPEQTLAHVRDKSLEFTPGARMSYSNSNYVLLGLLVERLSGKSYAEYLRASIFEPLGMNDSGYDVSAVILPQRASGYTAGARANAPYTDMTVPHGAGGLYSTTEDLLRWTQGLFGGRLLEAESLEKMITPHQSDYAFGVIVNAAGGRRSVSHGGGIEGFNTLLAYYPESKVTIAVLGNVNGQAPTQLATQLGALAHGETVRTSAERTEIELPRAKLERLVGNYAILPTAMMRITVVGDQLQSQLGNQPVVPLFAESETVFFPRVVEAELTFELDASGTATALTLRQNGREVRGPRVAERTEIVLPPAVLERYTGTYQLQPGFDLVITLENGQLISQATGQAKAPLFAEAENKFFLKVAPAQLEFVSEGGRVTGLVLYQGGRETRAPRQ
jgi:CubicO group peptidase (beta-lactamase class C family)